MEVLANKLKIVASEIKSHASNSPNQPEFIFLKGLEDFCNFRIFHSDNNKEQFLCFYISHLIGSFFSNFGGDTPYEPEIYDTKVNFYNFFSERLALLSEQITDNRIDNSIDVLAEITRQYISGIKYLNKL